MVKIKSESYVSMHRAKDSLNQEKHVIDLMVNEHMDDVKAFLPQCDLQRVEQFEAAFWQGVAHSVERYERYFQTVVASGLDRKSFAVNWLPTIRDSDAFAPPYVFARFDGKDPRQLVLAQIRKNLGTQTRVDSVRSLWDGHHWSYESQGGDA